MSSVGTTLRARGTALQYVLSRYDATGKRGSTYVLSRYDATGQRVSIVIRHGGIHIEKPSYYVSNKLSILIIIIFDSTTTVVYPEFV